MSEVIFAPPVSWHTVTRVRSTVLLASRGSLSANGHEAAYRAALDAESRRVLDETVVGVWLPVTIAEAHYRACDSLGFSGEAVAALGRATNERVKGTLYGTFVRLFQEAGGGPWSVLPHWQRFWDRGYDGGGMRVTKLGPKDARVDVMGCTLCEFAYFRNALRGLSAGFAEIFCTKIYVNEIAAKREKNCVTYRFQWA